MFLVREVGDPAGGPTPRGCESCINAMVHFGVLDWPELAWTEEWRVPPQPAPEPDRFPPEVAHALVDGGWTLPDLSHEVAVSHIVNEVLSVSGLTHRHQSFPAAEQTIYAFPRSTPGARAPVSMSGSGRSVSRPPGSRTPLTPSATSPR